MKDILFCALGFLISASAMAGGSSLKDMEDGYVRGGSTWFQLKDEYTAPNGAAAGEYERTEMWQQFKLIAQGRAVYLRPDFALGINMTTFPGKGEDGKTAAKFFQDAGSGKVYWSITMESRAADGTMQTQQGQSELTFVKGTWGDYEKGGDVELDFSEAESQANGKYVKSLMDTGWEIFRNDVIKMYPGVTFGPVQKLVDGSSRFRITLKANLKKAAFVYPRWTNEYMFTSHKEY
ncbi:hypothetical protein K2X33_02420 [bacterium]|nr:hypothetical protein [bacterium]